MKQKIFSQRYGEYDGADVNSGGGRGADDNLHPTDFEHRHQEEPAQAGMVRLFFDGC